MGFKDIALVGQPFVGGSPFMVGPLREEIHPVLERRETGRLSQTAGRRRRGLVGRGSGLIGVGGLRRRLSGHRVVCFGRVFV